MPRHQLAQLNVGRILAPLDSPQLAGFVARLDEINALTDAAPGFVWRFQTEDGNATALRPFDDDRMLVNFSVWQSAEVMRQRRQWFEQLDQPFTVLWWVPAGHRPTVQEAIERFEHLRRTGRRRTPSRFNSALRRPGRGGLCGPSSGRMPCHLTRA